MSTSRLGLYMQWASHFGSNVLSCAKISGVANYRDTGLIITAWLSRIMTLCFVYSRLFYESRNTSDTDSLQLSSDLLCLVLVYHTKGYLHQSEGTQTSMLISELERAQYY